MSDVMLLGVLRMPMPEVPDPMTLRQFVSRARQAACRIEADAGELAELREEIERLRELGAETQEEMEGYREECVRLRLVLAAERERCARLCETADGFRDQREHGGKLAALIRKAAKG